MELSSSILSDIIIYSKYARYIPEFGRRELWVEIVERDENMLIKKYPKLEEEIRAAFKFVYDKKVLPSMRTLQFAGKSIEINPCRGYNCSYLPIDSWEVFHETMFLLLGGTGVGYSVQKHHVEKLPEIKRPTKRKKRFVVGDSIEGWADAIKVLMKSYFFGTSEIDFDFSDIRPKGALLKTSGGRAPGPQPLKDCIHNIKKILDRKNPGDKLSTLECHDIQCFIADAVLSGGIRRAAMIALFTVDDEEMLTCKYGNWAELNPQRGRANNSAVIVRHKIKKGRFFEIWDKVKHSGTGDPAIWFTNNQDWGCNPCCEASLRPNQFCNLTTINGSNLVDQNDLNERARAASFIGTLQAGFTDFHYLRDIWKINTEKDALIGVSITGIASGQIDKLSTEEATEIVKTENKRVAKLIGINQAARCTVIKPEGTSSLVLGTSSGIHPWHSQYYIRRIRLLKNEALYKYLIKKLPQLIEDDFYKSSTEGVLSIPIKAPDGAIFRDENVLQLLERIKKFNISWIQPGHRKGDNTHNVSATISVKDNEWDQVGEWMWENRTFYNGLAVFPYYGGNHKQAPFEEIDKSTYEKMIKYVKEIDISEIEELEDNTTTKDQAACSGGACTITKA